MTKFSSTDKKLIEALKMPDRTFIYDTTHIFHRNNSMRKVIWAEIAEDIGISSLECQVIWKSLKRRYRCVYDQIVKNENEVEPKTIKPDLLKIHNEMSFLEVYLKAEDSFHSNSSMSPSLKQSYLYDDVSSSDDPLNSAEDISSSSSLLSANSIGRQPIKRRRITENKTRNQLENKPEQRTIDVLGNAFKAMSSRHEILLELVRSKKENHIKKFTEYLAAVLETKPANIQNEIISKINAIMSEYNNI